MRSVRYQEIATELRGRIAAGEFAGGRPAAERGAARRDVRREPGHDPPRARSAARRRADRLAPGLGWFVAADPLRQSLGRLGHDRGAARRRGHRVGAPRPRLRLRRPRPRACARCSACAACSKSAAATSPTGIRSRASPCGAPSGSGKGLSLADVERAPFYELLDAQLGGASQTIAAAAATKADAELLEVPVGSPVLHVPAHDAHGRRRTGAATASTCSPATAPSSSSTCPSPTARWRRRGSGSSSSTRAATVRGRDRRSTSTHWIARESEAFAAVLDAGDLDARVPGCPDWALRDLARAPRTRAAVLGRRSCASAPTSSRRVPTIEPSRSTTPSSRRGCARRRATCSTRCAPRPRDTPAWVWWRDDRTVGAIARHQVQEAAVHRWDAQSAVGAPAAARTSRSPTTASKSSCGSRASCATRRRSRSRSRTPVGRSRCPTSPPSVTVSATASDLVLLLYGRIAADERARRRRPRRARRVPGADRLRFLPDFRQ